MTRDPAGETETGISIKDTDLKTLFELADTKDFGWVS